MSDCIVGKFVVQAFPRPQDGEVCLIRERYAKQNIRANLEDLYDLQYAVQKAIRLMLDSSDKDC